MKKRNWIFIVVVALALCQLAFLGAKEKAPAASEPAAAAPAAKDLSFPEMMNQLSRGMGLWQTLSVDQKKQALSAVISFYKSQNNIAILNPADFYVGKVDDAVRSNPNFAATNVMTIVKILAVMEYDFYNGQNKDELAKEVLGEKMAQMVRLQKQMQGR